MNQFEGCVFHFNDGVEEADAWFVIEDVIPEDSRCLVPRNQVYFLSAETSWRADKFLTSEAERFLSQFQRVFSCYAVRHRSVKFEPPFLPWMVNANHGSIFAPHSRDINYFRDLSYFRKDFPISMFCSDQNWTPMHQLRLRFAEYLKKYFGDDLDWFGNGINEIDEKWDGLAPYQRTIVLENRSDNGIFTEKICDPFLTLTQPIYWGAPNISRYLPVSAQFQISLESFRDSARKIKELMSNKITSEEIDLLIQGKNSVIGKLHFLRRIATIAKRTSQTRRKFEALHLQPRASFVAQSGASRTNLLTRTVTRRRLQ